MGDHFGIKLDEGELIGGDSIVDEDGFDRTLAAARVAVDAFIGIDVEHLTSFVKTFTGANHHAVGVPAAKTGFANDVSHRTNLPSQPTWANRLQGGSTHSRGAE